MHSEFSEWFQTANIPLQADVLQKRWAGVDAFEVDCADVVSLVEVFFGNFANKDTFLATFRKAFQDADPSFRMRENNLELSVLAGASLVSVMEEGSVDLADFTAMAIVACAAQNLRTTPCVAEIPELAVRYLARRTVKRGQLDPDETDELEDGEITLMQLRRDVDLLGEETNVLWWVFGETSRDTDIRWSKNSVEAVAIMAGKELANLTRLAPGPAAAAPLLDRVIKYSKAKPPAQISINDAIAELSTDWKQKFIQNHHVSVLNFITPVSTGIKLSVDLAAGNAWLQTIKVATKIQHGGRIAPNLLAYQIYLECLLAQMWTKLA